MDDKNREPKKKKSFLLIALKVSFFAVVSLFLLVVVGYFALDLVLYNQDSLLTAESAFSENAVVLRIFRIFMYLAFVFLFPFIVRLKVKIHPSRETEASGAILIFQAVIAALFLFTEIFIVG